MARDLDLLQQRDKRLAADYNRLKCQEIPIRVSSVRIYIKLQYQQILKALSVIYSISPRRVEYVIGEQNKMTPTELADAVPAQ